MSLKPILFSGPMVSKILFGMKTQTRRVIKKAGYAPWSAGDTLWVRETWNRGDDGKFIYRADYDMPGTKWKPAIFMPRDACRIFLHVISVSTQKLCYISPGDARAEGVGSVDEYRDLWDSLNSKRGYGWDKNPDVWVVGFRRTRD